MTDSTHDKTATRSNTTLRGCEITSQEREDREVEEDREAYRERIRRIIEEDCDILDELA